MCGMPKNGGIVTCQSPAPAYGGLFQIQPTRPMNGLRILPLLVAVSSMVPAVTNLHAQVHLDWVATYDDPTNDPAIEDESGVIGAVVDTAGHTYVVGRSADSSRLFRITLVKYSPVGQLLWVQHYAGPGASRNSPVAVALDPDQNVIVTGNADFGPDGNSDIAILTVKYDPSGVLLWANRHQAPAPDRSYARFLAVDAAGHAYVTGLNYDAEGSPGTLTIKYDGTTGSELWANRLERSSGMALAVDEKEQLYVAGFGTARCRDTASDDCPVIGFVTKHDSDGREMWVRTYQLHRGRNVQFNAITLTPSGQPTVTGVVWGGKQASTEVVTIQYNERGQRRWLTQDLDPTGGAAAGLWIASAPDGRIVVTSAGATTRQYSSTGRLVWTHQGEGYVTGTTLDAAGNVYTSSRLFNLYEDSRVTKLNSQGDRQWSIDYNPTGTAMELLLAVALGPDGSIHLAGNYYADRNATHLLDFLTLVLRQP